MATDVYFAFLALLVHVCLPYTKALSLPTDNSFQYLVERKNADPEIIQLSEVGKPESRIVGGNETGVLPWQVSILMDSSHFCAGSLISLDRVLTSAQCVQGYSSFELHFGSVFVHVNETTDTEVQIRTTTSSIVHPRYSRETLEHDIAILVLDTRVEESDTVFPIALPSSQDLPNESYLGEVATLAGWGSTQDGVTGLSNMSEVLQGISVTVISNEDCANSTFGSLIVTSHICTSGEEGGGLCVGDAGSPLVYHDPVQGNPIQIGIGSFVSADGCSAGMPSGFTRISSYMDWIVDPYGEHSRSTAVGARTSLVALTLVLMQLLR